MQIYFKQDIKLARKFEGGLKYMRLQSC